MFLNQSYLSFGGYVWQNWGLHFVSYTPSYFCRKYFSGQLLTDLWGTPQYLKGRMMIEMETMMIIWWRFKKHVKYHIILMWTYVSSDIKGHFVFPNCQFRKRWFGPQQAKSRSWLWSLRPFLSLSFTTKCHRCQSVKWENIALAVQKLVNICMVKTYILSLDWHLPFYFLKYPGNLDKVQKNSSFSSGDRP